MAKLFQINQDSVSAEVRALRNQVEKLQAELVFYQDDASGPEELQVMKQKISVLEAHNVELQQELQEQRVRVDEDDDGFRLENALFAYGDGYSSDCGAKAMDILDDMENDAKELEHSCLQQKLDMELKELDKKLEQKEAEMKRFNSNDTSIIRHHHEKKLLELEPEKKVLQKEIEDLKYNLSNIPSTPDDGAQKLKEEYLQKLNALEALGI
ncbi:hypothetical protein K1719_016143 [Acacia pycnantha]|nr:hypothetical protein K1719_016143 [Acacia pycnantha]